MSHYLRDKNTGNILTPRSKKIIHYSYDDFIKAIVSTDCCFVCGAEAGSKPFNDEHVIPNWILKHFGTAKSFMVLPNKTTIKNSQYKVPCCQECNSNLSIEFEHFMSDFLKRNYQDIISDLQKDSRLYKKLFHWLCLLFFKTHYKDCFLMAERDKRKPAGKIADTYCWHTLYHIHDLARQHYTKAQVSDNVYGTIAVFEALPEEEPDDFDYLDNLTSQVMLVRVGRIIIFAVLNDSGICHTAYRSFLSKISGPLSPVQVRELFARFRYLNENIKERPTFYTAIDKKKGHRIKARVPRYEILNGAEERVSLFKLMRYYLEDIMPDQLPNRMQLLGDIENGNAQFIFDENYQFYQH